MPAPIKPNTEAARAVKAANARQRKIDAAVATLRTLEQPVLTTAEVAELLEKYPEYAVSELGCWMRGYFRLPDAD